MSVTPSHQQLARYVTGKSSQEEDAQIRAWLESDPEARLQLEGLGQNPLSDTFLRDPEETLARILRQLPAQEIITEAERRVPSISDRDPVRQSVIHRFRPGFTYRVAAAIVVLVAAGWMLTRLFESPDGPVPLVVLVTENGQRTESTLTDGTDIELNVASRLSYPEAFPPDRREVWLEGEAFFEVAADADRPFLIHTGNITVTVLGTAFNVSAYAEDVRVEVTVVEGRVSVRGNEQPESMATPLEPGQRGTLTTSDDPGISPAVSIQNVDLATLLSWRRGELVFQGTTLAEVGRAIARWYDVEVYIDGDALSALRLDAAFSNEPLSEVLGTVAVALDLTYRMEEQHIIFTRP